MLADYLTHRGSELMATSPSGAAATASAWWQAVRALRREAWGESIAGFLFVGPAVALFLIFNAYPIIRGLVIAFSDYRYLVPDYAPFNGFDNWLAMANDRVFWESFGRSLQYTAIYFALNFIMAFFVAVLISQVHGPREAGVYRVISYLPVILPASVALLVWRQFLSPEFGYIAVLLKGLFGPAVSAWLRDARAVVPILATIAAWKAMGSNVLLLLVGLYSINGELLVGRGISNAIQRGIHIELAILGVALGKNALDIIGDKLLIVFSVILEDALDELKPLSESLILNIEGEHFSI
jgi:ABC-type sugar transport system permease subunit